MRKLLIMLLALLYPVIVISQVKYQRVTNFKIGSHSFKLLCSEKSEPDTLIINGKMFTILSAGAETSCYSKDNKWEWSNTMWTVTHRSDRYLIDDFWDDVFLAYYNKSRTKIIRIDRVFYGKKIKSW